MHIPAEGLPHVMHIHGEGLQLTIMLHAYMYVLLADQWEGPGCLGLSSLSRFKALGNVVSGYDESVHSNMH